MHGLQRPTNNVTGDRRRGRSLARGASAFTARLGSKRDTKRFGN